MADAELPVRAGMHAGIIETRDDGDVSGLTVNIAAQVQANAGQRAGRCTRRTMARSVARHSAATTSAVRTQSGPADASLVTRHSILALRSHGQRRSREAPNEASQVQGNWAGRNWCATPNGPRHRRAPCCNPERAGAGSGRSELLPRTRGGSQPSTRLRPKTEMSAQNTHEASAPKAHRSTHLSPFSPPPVRVPAGRCPRFARRRGWVPQP
jgi:hypothetical protein